jgi:hypothetical protein
MSIWKVLLARSDKPWQVLEVRIWSSEGCHDTAYLGDVRSNWRYVKVQAKNIDHSK